MVLRLLSFETMKITIGGDDEVAFRLAEALMLDHEVSLILPSGSRETALDRLDVRVHHGSINAAATLKQADIDSADYYVACSRADERNLVSCAEAKRLGARDVTCFLRRHEVQTNELEAEALARSLHIDQVVLPAVRLGREIIKIVMVPGALEADSFENGRVRLVRRRIAEDSPITRGTLKEIGIPQGVVLVFGQHEEEKGFIPKGDTRFQPGDKVTAMGSLEGINRLLTQYLVDPTVGRNPQQAVVVGGGSVGFGVTERLEKAGWTVKLIESNEERAMDIAPRLKSLVLHGDGTDLELLQQEAVSDSPVLIAVTSSDEKNLLISLLAKRMGVPRIITRADKASNEWLFEQVGIDVVRSATGAAIRAVERRVNRADRDLMAEFDHGEARVLRLTIPEGLPPTPLYALSAPVTAIVGAVLHDDNVIIPQGRDTIQGGDNILVFCTAEDSEATHEFFETFTAPTPAE